MEEIIDIKHNLEKAEISPEKINKIMTLYNDNYDLFKTINYDFVKSNLFDKFEINKLDAILSSKITQEKLCKIKPNHISLFIKLINLYSDEIYWIPYFCSLLDNFINEDFIDLIDSISNNDTIDLSQVNLVLTSKRNYLNLKSIEDLYNKDNILEQKILNSQKENNINDYKNYILLKHFNLSLEESKILCNKYTYKIENLNTKEYINTKNFLIDLKNIVKSQNIDEINNILKYTKKELISYPNLQSKIQQMYAEEYNSVLFDANNKPFVYEDGVKIIDAGLEFNMILRGDGAYSSSLLETSNYKEQWNYKSKTSRSFSNSHISNNKLRNFSMQSNNEVILYAFSNIDKNGIVENSIGDNATMIRREKSLDPRSLQDIEKGFKNPVIGDDCGQRFTSFKQIIDDSCCDVYTEITLERFKTTNNKEEKIEPSYIVYMKYNDEYKNDLIYKKSIKAAKDFSIPLVIIDVEKVLKNEYEKIEEKIKNLPNSFTVTNIMDILQNYTNNYTIPGKSDAKKLYDIYFPLKVNDKNYLEEFIENIIKTAKELNKPPIFYEELFDKIMVLNSKKRVISNLFLFKLHKSNPYMKLNLEKYIDEICDITKEDIPYALKINKVFYDYYQMLKNVELCKNNNITITDKILLSFSVTLKEKIDLLNSYNIPITQELLNKDKYDLIKNSKICIENNLEITEQFLLMDSSDLANYVVESMTQNNIEEQNMKKEWSIDDETWENSSDSRKK